MTEHPSNSLNSTHHSSNQGSIENSLTDWRHLTAAQREIAYSPSSCIGGDYRSFIKQYQTQSQQALAEAQALGAQWQRITLSDCSIEFCKATAPSNSPEKDQTAPLLVFIHGGYWQELSAKDSLFAAAQCARSGINFAALDYGLAPQFNLSQIVQQCQLSLKYLVTHSAELQIDVSRIVIAGSSAGAHLATLTGLNDIQIAGLVLVSGIYDLEPLIGTSINDALGLTPTEARRLSPLYELNPEKKYSTLKIPNTVVCWGENETLAFKLQSRTYAKLLQDQAANTSTVHTFEVAHANHFDIVLGLMDPSKELGQATRELFALPPGKLI